MGRMCRPLRQSFKSIQTMAGTLYVVSTPIGNLEDCTSRAIRILREVAVVAAEDPQQTRALFTHYAIETPLTSYHNLNKEEKAPVLVKRLQEGQSIALVSDAGTPVVSDPGSLLITQVLQAGIRVVPVPGPSAILAAISVSGFSGDAFTFAGALPSQSGPRRQLLESLKQERRTLVFFESSGQLRATLETMRDVLGNRRITLAKDLTKPSEELILGTAEELFKTAASRPLDGEMTLVVEGYRGGERARLPGASQRAKRLRAFGS